MIIFIFLLSIASPLVIANDLMNLLRESTLIHSEAPYGYSTNSLSFKYGELINNKTKEEYEYFIDNLMTEAERFKHAAPKEISDRSFDGC
ncbi:MAG TPA: hypothetical protein VEK06_03405, partial [Myxococcota bacterium]|nr:hypothetical protein [Myxococcota bacterium]